MNPGQEMIRLYAKQLRLPTLAQIDDLIRQAEEQGLSYADFLGQVLQREINQREENQQRLKIRKAKFPLEKSLDTFDLSRLTQVEDALIWQLATGEFVKRRENVIMIGNPGTGKTHLAIGLGRRMCSYGFKVRFYTAANLVAELIEAQLNQNLLKLQKSIAKLDLLILDELSYLSFTRNQAELLFHVLSERNERGSVIITTNLEFSRWTEIFPDTMLTAALVDRLTHRAHILDMNVPSYRLEQRLKQQRGGESQG
jgi:DNA replication protein DnaC